MRQRVSPGEHFRRGNAATTVIVALQWASKRPRRAVAEPAPRPDARAPDRGSPHVPGREPTPESVYQPDAARRS